MSLIHVLISFNLLLKCSIRLHKLQTTRSWDYLGLSYQSPNNLLYDTNMGDGVIIGLLDTGIWPESEILEDDGLGPIPSRWKGVCESGDLFNSTNCNRKLIGARWFIKGFLADYGQPFNTTENIDYLSPRDAIGHANQVEPHMKIICSANADNILIRPQLLLIRAYLY